MASSWQLLGSTTLGVAGDQIDVTIAAKKYLIIKVFAVGMQYSALLACASIIGNCIVRCYYCNLL